LIALLLRLLIIRSHAARVLRDDRASLPLALTQMNSNSKTAHGPILRVFQSKDQTRAFYNKISRVYDLLSERSEAPMRKAGLAC
jgi:hypothetical protein